jgi:hypothetical protein
MAKAMNGLPLIRYAVFVRFVEPVQEVRIGIPAISGKAAREYVEQDILVDFAAAPAAHRPIVDRVELADEPGEVVA